MEIEKMSTEEIEKELEKRKAVKPRATPESVAKIVIKCLENGELATIDELLKRLDWTPESRDWENQLLLGRIGCSEKWFLFTGEEATDPFYVDWEFIDFDASKIGKVTP